MYYYSHVLISACYRDYVCIHLSWWLYMSSSVCLHFQPCTILTGLVIRCLLCVHYVHVHQVINSTASSRALDQYNIINIISSKRCVLHWWRASLFCGWLCCNEQSGIINLLNAYWRKKKMLYQITWVVIYKKSKEKTYIYINLKLLVCVCFTYSTTVSLIVTF